MSVTAKEIQPFADWATTSSPVVNYFVEGHLKVVEPAAARRRRARQEATTN